MGLPAFDMSAFEAAETAIAHSPRASTSVLFGPGVQKHATEAEYRTRIRRSIDAHIAQIDTWQRHSLSSAIHMRDTLMHGMSIMPIAFFEDVDHRLLAYEAATADEARQILQSDKEFLHHLTARLDEVAVMAPSAARFLRREFRRLEQALEARQETFKRTEIIAQRARAVLREYAVGQTIPKPTFGDADAASTYLERAATRPADVEGVTARANRLLQRFSKAAAYLGR